MISIGNDIVDLNYTDRVRTNNPKFYTKFIVQSELSLLDHTDAIQMPFDVYAWMLWSIKESVYKFLKRHQPDLVFSPAKIIIQHLKKLNDIYTGEVVYNNHRLYLRSVVSQEVIFSMVDSSSDFQNIYWDTQKVESDNQGQQSIKVRVFLLQKLTSVFPQKKFTISKNQECGYPIIINNGVDTSIPLSFAHHGQYVSYCFKLFP